MSDRENRLMRCFESVFPGLTPEEIQAGSSEQGTWDSLSLVTLVAVVQEEFSVEIGQDELSTLDSYEAFRAYVQRLEPSEK
jgi:acyl carrier protein